MGNEFKINVAPPVDLLLKGSPMDTLKGWLKAVMSENQDGPLRIAFHLDVGYDQDNCLSIYHELLKSELITPGRLY